MLCSAEARLAARWINSHSAALRARLAPIKLTGFLRGVRVRKVNEGGTLRLTGVVGEDADPHWLQLALAEDLLDVLLRDVPQTPHKHRIFLVTLLLLRGATLTAAIATAATTVLVAHIATVAIIHI